MRHPVGTKVGNHKLALQAKLLGDRVRPFKSFVLPKIDAVLHDDNLAALNTFPQHIHFEGVRHRHDSICRAISEQLNPLEYLDNGLTLNSAHSENRLRPQIADFQYPGDAS